jgi:hypothetical protein
VGKIACRIVAVWPRPRVISPTPTITETSARWQSRPRGHIRAFTPVFDGLCARETSRHINVAADAFAHPRYFASSFSIAGFNAAARLSGVIGPISLWAMRPSRPTTNVSGTP